MSKIQNWTYEQAWQNWFKAALAISALTSILGISTVASSATSTPAPVSAACKATFSAVVKADRVYISLQFDVVAAAKGYVASNSLTNRLVYNNSYIKAIQAANAELNIAIKNPACYPAKNITSYVANVKTNSTEIANIIAANVNGQLVGDPKKMATFKPIGLLR